MKNELNAKAFGISLAVVSALVMLLLGVLGNLGYYMGGVDIMRQMHVFFSLSVFGIIAGMIEAAVISFVFGWLIALVYNKYA